MGFRTIISAGFLIGGALMWLSVFLRWRDLLRTGRAYLAMRGAALYALGFLATLVIAVFSDFDTAEAVVLMMLPSTLLAIFEAGAVWGRRNAPLQVAGGTTASRPSAFSD